MSAAEEKHQCEFTKLETGTRCLAVGREVLKYKGVDHYYCCSHFKRLPPLADESSDSESTEDDDDDLPPQAESSQPAAESNQPTAESSQSTTESTQPTTESVIFTVKVEPIYAAILANDQSTEELDEDDDDPKLAPSASTPATSEATEDSEAPEEEEERPSLSRARVLNMAQTVETLAAKTKKLKIDGLTEWAAKNQNIAKACYEWDALRVKEERLAKLKKKIPSSKVKVHPVMKIANEFINSVSRQGLVKYCNFIHPALGAVVQVLAMDEQDIAAAMGESLAATPPAQPTAPESHSSSSSQ